MRTLARVRAGNGAAAAVASRRAEAIIYLPEQVLARTFRSPIKIV
jgi:hypothetical protein